MAAVVVFFSVTPPSSDYFLGSQNINTMFGTNVVYMILALAALFPMISNSFDFSVGATMVLSDVLCAGLQQKSGMSLALAIVLAMLASLVVGIVNGTFVTRFKMSPFVTTMGMSMVLYGITLWYSAGSTFQLSVTSPLFTFATSRWFSLPSIFFVMLILAAVVWYVLRHTPYGRSLYAIGSNPVSARLVGVRVDRNMMIAFILSAVISGFAGIIELGYQAVATAQDGGSFLFPALAAVFLGATAITPGFFNVVGTVISALFVSIAVSGLTLMGASGWPSYVFNGGALLVAVALSTYLGRRKLRGKG
ncbi:MAG: ABC transporter permease [Nocardioides sp.]